MGAVSEALEADQQEVDAADSRVKVEFTIQTFVLQSLLEKSFRVLPKRGSMPILNNFRIEATDGRLVVASTDLELSCIGSTRLVEVDTEGVVVVPGDKLMEIVRSCGDSDIRVSVHGNDLRLTNASTGWDLRLMHERDYPPLIDVAIDSVMVDRAKFLASIKKVYRAACTETVRPQLMLLDIRDGKMSAMDGVRCQQATLPWWPKDLDLQIPIGAVSELLWFLEASELEEIGIATSVEFLLFSFGSDFLIAQQMAYQFPDIEKSLLKPALENEDELIVDRHELITAVKRVSINCDTNSRSVALKLRKNECVVSARDSMGNSATETISASWTAKSREIVLNAKFLLELLDMSVSSSSHFWLGHDTKRRKCSVLLKDQLQLVADTDTEDGGTVEGLKAGLLGVLQQMRLDN